MVLKCTCKGLQKSISELELWNLRQKRCDTSKSTLFLKIDETVYNTVYPTDFESSKNFWNVVLTIFQCVLHYYTGCPKKHGNSVTNWILSLLWISSVYNVSARWTVKTKFTLFVYMLQFSCFTKYNRMQSKHKQTKCEHSRRNSYRLQLSQ